MSLQDALYLELNWLEEQIQTLQTEAKEVCDVSESEPDVEKGEELEGRIQNKERILTSLKEPLQNRTPER